MTRVGAVDTAENYRRFAEEIRATEGSPTYETLALAVAEDHDALAFLQELPPPKRSPHLLFAAARAVLGEVPDPRSLHELVMARPDDLRHILSTRRTQVNEPARSAVLLPALTALDGPLALLEVGAAAGLTLLPDVYSYDYDGHRVQGLDPEAPTLRCRPLGPVPLPRQVPEVVWRVGIDLQPLDVTDDDDVAWLSCLVLTGAADRAERLRRAVTAARRRPPVVHRGDLVDDLARVAAGAPSDATLVVYDSAVLDEVDDDKCDAFADAVSQLDAVWLSSERDRVVQRMGVDRVDPGVLILVRDRHEVLARSDPPATWIEWLGPGP